MPHYEENAWRVTKGWWLGAGGWADRLHDWQLAERQPVILSDTHPSSNGWDVWIKGERPHKASCHLNGCQFLHSQTRKWAMVIKCKASIKCLKMRLYCLRSTESKPVRHSRDQHLKSSYNILKNASNHICKQLAGNFVRRAWAHTEEEGDNELMNEDMLCSQALLQLIHQIMRLPNRNSFALFFVNLTSFSWTKHLYEIPSKRVQ